MSRVDDVTSTWNQTCDVTTEPNIIHKVQNPVPQADLEKAKEFMQQQLNTMTRLVRAQDALSGSQPTPATSTTVSTVDAGQIGVLDSNGGLTHVDFDRELEGLLGSYSAGSEQVISKEENKKKTVHHFGPETIKQENIKPPSAKRAKTNDSNPLDKYELLNVDRCFPPNAVAPLSNTLPFDLSKVKSESNNTDGPNTTLPTFFKCSYYQEQAAQAAISSSKAQDAKTNLPVVYVPKLSSAVKQSTSTSTPEPSKEKLDSSPAPLYQEQTPATRPLVFDDDTVVTSPNPTNVTSTKLTVMSVEDNDEVEEIGTSKNPDVCDVIDTSPAPSMTSSHESATPFDPYALPTLSPKSLQQFLDADINAMMSGHKRKCSFDDDLIDDDVFADQSSLMNACGIFNPQNQPFLSNIT